MARIARRLGEAAQRAEERRARENLAPRLLTVVPRLRSLSIFIEDCSAGSVARLKHVRRVVVESAPALFWIGCSESNCKDGGHDVTDLVVGALLRGETSFQGEDRCYGALGPSGCTRVMHFDASAEYASGP